MRAMYTQPWNLLVRVRSVGGRVLGVRAGMSIRWTGFLSCRSLWDWKWTIWSERTSGILRATSNNFLFFKFIKKSSETCSEILHTEHQTFIFQSHFKYNMQIFFLQNLHVTIEGTGHFLIFISFRCCENHIKVYQLTSIKAESVNTEVPVHPCGGVQ